MLVRKRQGSSSQSNIKEYCVSYSNGDVERESIKESRLDQGQCVTPGHDPCLQLPATLRSQSGDQLTEPTTTWNTNNIKHNNKNKISNDETNATPRHDNEHRETTEHRAAKSQHTLGHGPSPHWTSTQQAGPPRLLFSTTL